MSEERSFFLSLFFELLNLPLLESGLDDRLDSLPSRFFFDSDFKFLGLIDLDAERFRSISSDSLLDEYLLKRKFCLPTLNLEITLKISNKL